MKEEIVVVGRAGRREKSAHARALRRLRRGVGLACGDLTRGFGARHFAAGFCGALCWMVPRCFRKRNTVRCCGSIWYRPGSVHHASATHPLFAILDIAAGAAVEARQFADEIVEVTQARARAANSKPPPAPSPRNSAVREVAARDEGVDQLGRKSFFLSHKGDGCHPKRSPPPTGCSRPPRFSFIVRNGASVSRSTARCDRSPAHRCGRCRRQADAVANCGASHCAIKA